jgi:murein DD-endopeptidase MepM/ murein hydrolase activator NlpD
VPPGGTVEVQPGDTLYELAARHRVSISELMSVNGLSDPTLRPGQKLVLPSTRSKTLVASRNPAPPAETASTPPAARPSEAQPMLGAARAEPPSQPEPETAPVGAAEHTYTVKSGDSLYGIAVRHKVPLAEIQSLNGITDPAKVMPGTVLRLPASATRPVASPIAPAARQPASQPTVINAKPHQVATLGNPATATDAAPDESARPAPAAVVPAITATPPALSQPRTAREQSEESAKPAPSEPAGFGRLRWPVRGRIVAAFGRRPDGQQNDGIKLAVPLGTEVHAAEAGVVAYAGNALKDYGNLVLLRHDNGWITAYAHNDSLAVKAGDRVTRGQVIARAGKTGAVDQPQLHFELRRGSSPVDPVPYLEKL